jgi:hypothetical protein
MHVDVQLEWEEALLREQRDVQQQHLQQVPVE